MVDIQTVTRELEHRPRRWLVTGAAGFIGSHLVEHLLELGQWVRGVDNFSTGHAQNVIDVVRSVGSRRARDFELIEADVRNRDDCREMVDGIDIVLHQAALGSVPRSVADPLSTLATNVTGFAELLDAARDAGVRRFVYASSSAVYGDEPSETKHEERLGKALSPYATSKLFDELYAEIYRRVYAVSAVGLRYFNVFGPRQDPNGAYAAVVPRWTRQLLSGGTCVLYGDGAKTRDFCYVDNVVQANLLAALAPDESLAERVFNVACGQSTRLDELFRLIRAAVSRFVPDAASAELSHEPARVGDIESSLARIERAERVLGYVPRWSVAEGLAATVRWFATEVPGDRSSALQAKGGALLQHTA